MSFGKEIEQLKQILGGASELVIAEYTGSIFWDGVFSIFIRVAILAFVAWFVWKSVLKCKQLIESDAMDVEMAVIVGVVLALVLFAVVGISLVGIPENVSQIMYPKAHAIRELISGIRG